MVGHLTIGVDDPIESSVNCVQHRQARPTIVVVDILPPVSVQGYVVEGTGELEAQRSSHLQRYVLRANPACELTSDPFA